MASSRRPRAYLDVAVGSAPPARLVFELRPDVAPRTCANFLALCSGERRRSKGNDAVIGVAFFEGPAVVPGDDLSSHHPGVCCAEIERAWNRGEN